MTSEHDRALSALGACDPSCSRDEWFALGCSAQANGLTFDDFDRWSSGGGNYRGTKDVLSMWHSIKPGGGIGAGTLFEFAGRAGWKGDHAQHLNGHASAPRVDAPKPREKAAGGPQFDFMAVWNEGATATFGHGYIARNLGLPDGLRVVPDDSPLTIAGQRVAGYLLVPAYDAAGTLQTWQAVPPEAGKDKLNAPGATIKGASFTVGGPLKAEGLAYVCEGIGHAWSAHQATGKPAVASFGAGNVERIAAQLRERYPTLQQVIVMDRGKEGDAERIARGVNGAWVELPADLPSNADLNDVHKQDGQDAVRAILAGAQQRKPRFRMLTADDLAALPPESWRVRDVMPDEGIAVIFGQAGSGKSFLVLDMLGAIGAGRDWFGYRVEQCPVTYVALEGKRGIAKRVKAYELHYGQPPAQMHYMTERFGLLEADDVSDLAEVIRAIGGTGGVVAIDTLNRAVPGADENTSKDMGLIIAAATELQAAIGGLVILVHHAGKDMTKGMRGHSSLIAALDASVEVTREGHARAIHVGKEKDAADGVTHPFRLEIVEVGTDRHGAPITSCVVVQEETPADALGRVKLPQGGNQRIIWEAVGELLRAARHFGMGGASASRPCIRVEDAIEGCRGRLACETDRQASRTRTAIEGLVNRGLLGLRDGWLWAP